MRGLDFDRLQRLCEYPLVISTYDYDLGVEHLLSFCHSQLGNPIWDMYFIIVNSRRSQAKGTQYRTVAMPISDNFLAVDLDVQVEFHHFVCKAMVSDPGEVDVAGLFCTSNFLAVHSCAHTYVRCM